MSNLNPCKRVGVDLTWRCNWRCSTCFYRRDKRFNTNYDKPLENLCSELKRASDRGCDHAVAVGWGETSLYPNLKAFVHESKQLGMTTSIISNGTTGVAKYEEIYEYGLDHFHFSMHGLGDTINRISENPRASEKQEELKKWLKSNKIPFRTNTTLQELNYRELPRIVSNLIENGAYHVVLLGFLPHYEWINHLQDVAVHPKDLQPYLETCLDLLEEAGVYATLRYHPFCHLKPKYWKYVVNARYVLFDPWEWEYGKLSSDINVVKGHAVNMGEQVAIQGSPCDECNLHMHCGGWNKTYAEGFGGADLKPCTDRINQLFGHYHTQNPANKLKGYIND